MKILFQINVVANSGSTGKIAEELGRKVIKLGWESYIAYGRWACPSQSKLIKIGSKWSIYMHVLISRLFDRHGFGSKNSTIKLIDKIEKIKPDIIHIHNIHGYYINCKILFEYLSKCNIPVVWTLHDCWSLTGHCVHFQDINCNKWKVYCSHCPDIKGYPSSIFVDNSHKNYFEKRILFLSVNKLIIVSVCNWLDNIVGQSFLQNKKRMVIVNGVDINVFKPIIDTSVLLKKYSLKSKFIVLSVANKWGRTKGEQDIYSLSKRTPDDIIFVMIGLEKNKIINLPPNIVGIERTESVQQLVNFYSLADVLINPTYQDTFPTVNLEALACGTPVITYDTGGSHDAISEGTGAIVKRGDKVSLLSELLLIKNNSKSYYSKNCRDRAVRLFDKDERYEDYLDLYKTIINR